MPGRTLTRITMCYPLHASVQPAHDVTSKRQRIRCQRYHAESIRVSLFPGDDVVETSE